LSSRSDVAQPVAKGCRPIEFPAALARNSPPKILELILFLADLSVREPEVATEGELRFGRLPLIRETRTAA
jgi:hypothetical protein